MKKYILNKILPVFALLVLVASCGKDHLELIPRGTSLELNYYQTEEQLFEGLVAVYDVLQWGGTSGAWTMTVGLLNAASDDCFAGGSDASDQPSWVAYDNFTLNSTLGPQEGLWTKYYAGIYRANLLLQKLDDAPVEISTSFKARLAAEAKFLRGFYYFELVRYFGSVPLLTEVVSVDEITTITQNTPAEIYAQIESDLNTARAASELPESVAPAEFGRITQGAVAALLGKVILFQNNDSRMIEAANLFEEVIGSGFYFLEANYEDIFSNQGEFGSESVFEIQHSSNKPGDFGYGFAAGPTVNPTEGNFNVQFFGMRDYVGPDYATGWSFCPVTPDLADFMAGDPRFEHTIVDANVLVAQGASFSPGFQNTNYFIKKYAPLEANRASDGDVALGWGTNQREIRLADIYLMAAEALVRGGGSDLTARTYVNEVRNRVGLGNLTTNASGPILLDLIYKERRLELATEGHRFFDLVRTGKAAQVLDGFNPGIHELLPIPQIEIDLTNGQINQNPGY
jgi:hypothetical protein